MIKYDKGFAIHGDIELR